MRINKSGQLYYWLVYRVVYFPPANFQQVTTNGYDPVTVLVMTYSICGFQPKGLFKSC